MPDYATCYNDILPIRNLPIVVEIRPLQQSKMKDKERSTDNPMRFRRKFMSAGVLYAKNFSITHFTMVLGVEYL